VQQHPAGFIPGHDHRQAARFFGPLHGTEVAQIYPQHGGIKGTNKGDAYVFML
jgi:hypothetical protein